MKPGEGAARPTAPGARLPLIIGTVAASLSFAFCLCFSKWSPRFGALLDPDAYGSLALCLWRGYGFVFEPHGLPTLHRGPGYPAFVVVALALFGGRFPGSLWVAQSLVHGLTAALACRLASRLWGRATAIAAGLGCAVGPALLWYVPRAWSETLLAFLCLSLFALLVGSPSHWPNRRSLGLGAVVAALSLTKGVFLPLVVLAPLLVLVAHRRVGLRRTLPIPLVAVLIVLPWTIRNYVISGALVPVELGAYFNMEAGNIFADKIAEHPLSYASIWEKYVVPVATEVSGGAPPGPRGELWKEHEYERRVLAEIKSNPGLLTKKLLVAGAMFWIIGDTPTKSLLNALTRLPILAFAVVGLHRAWRRTPAAKTAAVFVAYYWACHVLFAPPARLSTPVLPILTVFAAAGVLSLVPRWREPIPERLVER